MGVPELGLNNDFQSSLNANSKSPKSDDSDLIGELESKNNNKGGQRKHSSTDKSTSVSCSVTSTPPL